MRARPISNASRYTYGLAVAPVAWRHGMEAGFLFAGLATLATLTAGAFPTRAEWRGQEVGEGSLPTLTGC